jgi:hypothetical protein
MAPDDVREVAVYGLNLLAVPILHVVPCGTMMASIAGTDDYYGPSER